MLVHHGQESLTDPDCAPESGTSVSISVTGSHALDGGATLMGPVTFCYLSLSLIPPPLNELRTNDLDCLQINYDSVMRSVRKNALGICYKPSTTFLNQEFVDKDLNSLKLLP